MQRFFDYWPEMISDRLTPRQRLDLSGFFLLQYALPVLVSADLAASLVTGTLPTAWPLSLATVLLSALAAGRSSTTQAGLPTVNTRLGRRPASCSSSPVSLALVARPWARRLASWSGLVRTLISRLF